jgi:DNA-directed RNA polymerase subunit P
MDEQKKTEAPEPRAGPNYECVRCGRRVEYQELERYISFRCPYCGYRIFRKVRAPIVKHIKAR